MWHSLAEHSFGTLLWETLVGHSCGTVSRGILSWGTFRGHSCGAALWATLVEHSCTTLSGDTLVEAQGLSHMAKSHITAWHTSLEGSHIRWKEVSDREMRVSFSLVFLVHVAHPMFNQCSVFPKQQQIQSDIYIQCPLQCSTYTWC